MGKNTPAQESGRSIRRPAIRASILGTALMAVIVGAACQPLQPSSAEGTSAGVVPPTGPVVSGTRAATNIATSRLASGTPDRVALVLPLSGRQQSLGLAVRDGFLAAWLGGATDRPGEVVLFDEAEIGAVEAYRRAIDAGASIIVGPLLKESVQAAARVAGVVPALALNFLGDGELAPPDFYQFGLAPEDEAREAALRAVAMGQVRAVALAPDSDWGRRLVNAFNTEFAVHGGQVLAGRFYEPGTADYSGPIQNLLQTSGSSERQRRLVAILNQPLEFTPRRRQDVDLLFLAANMAAGRQIGPQLRFYDAGDIPTYSTSAIYEDGSGEESDLDGIMFPDSPWVVAPTPAATATRSTLVRYGSPSTLGLSRLYALGYDAETILPRLANGALRSGEVPGMTGLLTMDAAGRIHRRLTWVVIRNGRPAQLAPPPSPPLISP